MRGVEYAWKKRMLLFSSHVETNILCNGGQGVVNCIMGSNAFIAMNTM
jgi:hypothetical protein